MALPLSHGLLRLRHCWSWCFRLQESNGRFDEEAEAGARDGFDTAVVFWIGIGVTAIELRLFGRGFGRGGLRRRWTGRIEVFGGAWWEGWMLDVR